MRSVLVTRPQPAADEFAEKLRKEGCRVYVAPMTEYAALDAGPIDLTGYQALIFTSAQAVRIFSGKESARHLPVLTVGDATAAAAAKAGFSRVYSARGDSTDVAALIQAEAGALGLKNILHICGDDTPEDIEKSAAGLGIEAVRLLVYESRPLKTLPEEVSEALQKNVIEMVTVFSVSAAENLVHFLAQKEFHGVSAKMEAVCLSARVANALKGTLPWQEIRVASQPRLDAVMDILRGQVSGLESAGQERRGKDRRQKHAEYDGHLVRGQSYTGHDRRTGHGRRDHEKRQHDRILEERMKFANRTALTFAFMFIAIVLGGTFIMAPEYLRMDKNKPGWFSHLGEKIPDVPQFSFGGVLNGIIEKIEGVTGTGRYAVYPETHTAPPESSLSQIIGNISALRSRAGGEAVMAQSVGKLRALLAGSSGRPEDLRQSVEAARREDPALDSLLQDVKKEDLAAGAMLLVLNEFRRNVYNRRPYAEDLALLQKFAGNDPEMNRALHRLSPYAEKGVMSRRALQTEFRALAADIVTAKLQGRDVSVQEEALERFEKLFAQGQASAIRGRETDAVVARAQLLLDQGDIQGAMHELQSLEGASAAAAEPWMNNAAGHMIVDQSSDDLTQGLLQTMPGGSGLSVEDIVRMLKESLRGPDVPYLSPALKGGDGGKNVLAPASKF